MIKEKKEGLSGEQLCEGLLPNEFATYINYTRSLAFEDKPDYAYLRKLFSRVFRSRGFRYDNVFDWTEKRFIEIHGQANSLAPPAPTELLRRKAKSPSATIARKVMARGGRRRAQRIQKGRRAGLKHH